VCRGSTHEALSSEAAGLRPGQSGLLALDWNNGNRTVLVDQRLTGMVLGQTLHTTQAEVYRALIEATAFGARMILERLEEYGVPVQRIVCAGGIAEKNPLLMQIYADVTGREMQISRSAQSCALGAALAGSVMAGVEHGGHRNYESAQEAMTGVKAETYKPDEAAKRTYDQIFEQYSLVHDAFGGVREVDLGGVMKTLLQIKGHAVNEAH
ncbi:MAG: ribulokinase, partial [Armatimonadetes bacterium]|nr:ribulokinase [Armatimonadota bacterium]